MQPSLQYKNKRYCIFQKCVFVALGTKREMRTLHIVICGLSGPALFFHIV